MRAGRGVMSPLVLQARARRRQGGQPGHDVEYSPHAAHARAPRAVERIMPAHARTSHGQVPCCTVEGLGRRQRAGTVGGLHENNPGYGGQNVPHRTVGKAPTLRCHRARSPCLLYTSPSPETSAHL
eukprot:11743078-Alexandrium_andersonii.AAC.1